MSSSGGSHEPASPSSSSSSSPPVTPPSPLPVSVGPGNQRYAFTPSPSPSPPFSPHADRTSLSSSSPLLARAACRTEPATTTVELLPSAFSMDASADRKQPPRRRPPGRRFDLGAWCLECMLVMVCCCCSSSMTSFKIDSELGKRLY